MELQRHNNSRAFTLPELMIGIALGTVLALSLGALLLQFSRGTTTLYGYTSVSAKDRIGLETMARDIRGAELFTNLNQTNITMLIEGEVVRIHFNSQQRQLVRTAPGGSQVLFPNCHNLQFAFFNRNPAAFESYVAANSVNCRVVQLTWASGVPSPSADPVLITHSMRFRNRRP